MKGHDDVTGRIAKPPEQLAGGRGWNRGAGSRAFGSDRIRPQSRRGRRWPRSTSPMGGPHRVLSTVLAISLLLFEQRQQLLENLIPMPVDFPSECVTEAGHTGVNRFTVCRDLRRRSIEVYPAAQGVAVPFNGLRAINRQAGLQVAPSIAISLPETGREEQQHLLLQSTVLGQLPKMGTLPVRDGAVTIGHCCRLYYQASSTSRSRSADPENKVYEVKRRTTGLGCQFRRRRSFLMISRRALAYSSMIRRASSEREGLGLGSSLLGAGSSGWFMAQIGQRRTKRGH